MIWVLFNISYVIIKEHIFRYLCVFRQYIAKFCFVWSFKNSILYKIFFGLYTLYIS